MKKIYNVEISAAEKCVTAIAGSLSVIGGLVLALGGTMAAISSVNNKIDSVGGGSFNSCCGGDSSDITSDQILAENMDDGDNY